MTPMKLPALLRRSVRAKTIALVVATTLVALALTAVALIYYAVRDYRQTHLADVLTQAEILARASAAAIAFNDAKEATRGLEVLNARRDIERAALYASDGTLFASYARDGRPALPATAPAPGHRIDGGLLKVFHPVREAGEILGAVYLESADRLAERLAAYALILAGVMAIALTAALALATRLQRALTGPILRVSDAALAVVERQDFSVRAQKTSEDEIGALTDAFNRMLEEIDRRTKALAESEQRFRTIADSAPVLIWLNDDTGAVFVNRAYLDYVGAGSEADLRGFDWTNYVHPADRDGYVRAWLQCARDGTRFDREFRLRRHDGSYRWMRSVAVPRVTDEGRRLGHTGCSFDVHDGRIAADALREAARRKDEFLATLAHELRNPLAPIRTAVHLMALDRDAMRRPALLQMLERQVGHMVRLVDDLIDVSRVSRGTVELRQEPLELARILHSAVETSKPLIDRARHRLEVVTGEEALVVMGDAVRLSQVFANLLNNAAKYTGDGGHIELRAWREGGEAVVTLRDDGIGIEPAQLPLLFEMFTQLDRGTARAQGGLGIGLALVKQLVEMHGGRVHADSAGTGRGSCFTVRLPLDEAHAPAAGEPSGGDAPQAPPGRRLLVVDDNRDAAESLALLLETLGADVRVAHDGGAALDAFDRFAPEFVLLDLGMPGMDGLEVARQLRERAENRSFALVALTGWGQADDRERTRAAGFDQHWVKPVDIDALKGLLHG